MFLIRKKDKKKNTSDTVTPLNTDTRYNDKIRYTDNGFARKKGKTKDQGVPQAAAHPRLQEDEETYKTKQAKIEQTYENH